MDGLSLVEEYRLLRQKILRESADETANGGPEQRLDALYTRIVTKPVVDIPAALEKLWFAHHCLTEEDDFKEAGNLIYQVCVALEILTRKEQKDIGVA